MNIFLLIMVILLLIVVIGLAVAHFSLQQRVAGLQDNIERLTANTNETALKGFELRLQEQAKGFTEHGEKYDREFNTLWAELENHRQEILSRVNNGINETRWRAYLEQRIASFGEIRANLNAIMNAQPELAAQLRESLPAYLIDDEILAGMLDYARLPFERINWLDQLILPVSARLDNRDGKNGNEALERSFNGLLTAIGYESILPGNGEIYRADHHEVVEQRLSNFPRGTILATRARGYGQEGAILRKAKVIISAGQS